MNNQNLPSTVAEFSADHDLSLILSDLDEIFYLAMSSACLQDFETQDRISFVRSHRAVKELVISLQRRSIQKQAP
jgi:hypothetical protein